MEGGPPSNFPNNQLFILNDFDTPVLPCYSGVFGVWDYCGVPFIKKSHKLFLYTLLEIVNSVLTTKLDLVADPISLTGVKARKRVNNAPA